ncbi:MAG: hypothetical protein ACJ0DJ_09960 [bacterium]
MDSDSCVIIAILGRRNNKEPKSIDSTQGRLRYGIVLGLLAAFGQAAGSIIARPIMMEESILLLHLQLELEFLPFVCCVSVSSRILFSDLKPITR